MTTQNSFRKLLLLGALLLQLLAPLLRTHAAPGDVDLSFDPGSGVNGPVNDIVVQPDGKVIIGGKFTTVRGLARTNVARLNADGSGDESFNAGSATAAWFNLFAVRLQADGMVLVGHDAGLSRFHSDGSLDSSFNASIEPTCGEEGCYTNVYSVAVQPDGKVLIGGAFWTGAGSNRVYGLARLNANGSLDPGFRPTAADYWHTPVVLQPDGKVLVGGSSVTNVCDAHGCYDEYRFSLRRLNANGTVDGTFNAGATLPWIQKIALQSDGKVLVVGSFTNGNLARLHGDGSLDGGFAPVTAGGIESVAVQADGQVLIAGAFDFVNGSLRRGIARLDASGNLDGSFNPVAEFTVLNYPPVQAVVVQADGRILIGGKFTSVNSTNHNYLDRLHPDGSLDSSFNPGRQVDRFSALAVQPDGKVLIGGPLTFVNGTNRYGNARLNGDGSVDPTFVPASFNPVVGDLGFPFNENSPYDSITLTAFAVQLDGKVLVAGVAVHWRCDPEFGCGTPYDGFFVTRHHTDGSRDTNFAPALGNQFYGGGETVSALAVQPDGRILVGGNFRAINGTNQNGIARLNANGTLGTTFSPGPDDYLKLDPARALQPDGKLLNGNAVFLVNGMYVRGVARFNTYGSLDSSFGSGTGFTVVNGAVRAIALQPDGNILIGGDFTSVNGVVRPHIARLYGNSVAPSLNLARSGGSMIISWPVSALNFQLQESTNLALPNSWSLVAQTAVTNGAQISVTVPASAARKFFRLGSE